MWPRREQAAEQQKPFGGGLAGRANAELNLHCNYMRIVAPTHLETRSLLLGVTARMRAAVRCASAHRKKREKSACP